MDSHLTKLFGVASEAGINQKEVKEISQLKKKVKPKHLTEPINFKYYAYICALIILLFAAGFPKVAFKRPKDYLMSLFYDMVYDPEGKCLVNPSRINFDVLRPIIKCDMCRNITEVPVIHNMTREYFMKHHAYTGIPVLVKGGAAKWTALDVFSYKYFKKLYTQGNSLQGFVDQKCQFFAYKTNFRTLSDVFSMSKKRAALKKDQWYIGWSNCLENVESLLRQHYDKPEFIPDDSEASHLDWIFMGGSGTGALMHIDAVNRPSWQAMIKGKKTWYIEPPPECAFQCQGNLHATMEPGDILVIDTNKWYHSTFIHPGSLAITIGSEYD